LLSIRLFWSHNPGIILNRLTWLTRVFFLFFLINFFFQFYPLILGWFGIRIHDFFFFLLSIRLFRSHDPWIMLNRLTWVDTSCFLCLFLIEFFLFFQFHHWINWELHFIICFDFLFIEKSWSHDQGCGF